MQAQPAPERMSVMDENASEVHTGSKGRRILIVGSAGQLGVELQKSFAGAGKITAVDLPTVDITNADQFRAFIREINPNLILNAAAYTAVDRAESEPQIAYAVNADA